MPVRSLSSIVQVLKFALMGIAPHSLERHIQWTVPMLRIAYSKSLALQEGLVEFLPFIGYQHALVPIEHIIWGLRAIRGFERCLHLKEVLQAFQDRLDNAIFCLCLLLTW